MNFGLKNHHFLELLLLFVEAITESGTAKIGRNKYKHYSIAGDKRR